MSRIRTIKPEFWTSEQVVSCSPNARLLFVGLWNFCDDHGVHPASFVIIKAEIFPVVNFSIADIKNWIGELITNELVREYAVDDKSYWIVTGWEKHQRINKPTYRHPLPLSGLKKIEDSSSNIRSLVDDNSTNIPIVGADSSMTDRNGKEGNGKEKDICEVKTSHEIVSHVISSNDVQRLFEYWQATIDHPRAKLDKKRRNRLEAAHKMGYSVEELKQAIDGCLKTPFNQGQNDSGQRYNDIELILRDAVRIDRFISNSSNPPSGIKTHNQATDLMAGVI